VAVNRFPRDDVGIALDDRTSDNDPRVIASDRRAGRECVGGEVAPTFSQFVEALGSGRGTAKSG
jgi:hypothetical protein